MWEGSLNAVSWTLEVTAPYKRHFLRQLGVKIVDRRFL